MARTRSSDEATDAWRWFCSACGHEWAARPVVIEPATLAVESARGGWLSRAWSRDHHDEDGPREMAPPADDATSASYGGELRAAREARSMSLADAATVTGIRERYLRALEGEEPPDVFPAPAYARFFAREYADALQVDADGIVSAFDRRYPLEIDETAASAPAPAIHDPHPRRRITAVTLVSLSVVALVAMAVAAGSRADRSSGALGTTPARAIVGSPTATAPPASDGATSPPVVRHLVAVLHFDATCWVKATSDGRVAVERTVGTGERLVVRADRKLELVLGNAGAVSMTLNGDPVRTGSSGAIATLEYRLRNGRVATVTG